MQSADVDPTDESTDCSGITAARDASARATAERGVGEEEKGTYSIHYIFLSTSCPKFCLSIVLVLPVCMIVIIID